MEKLIGSFSPSRKLPDGLGLQGEQLDLAKAHICIAKSVTILFDTFRSRGYGDSQIVESMSKMLCMSSGAIRALVKIHKYYSAPTNPQHTKFEYFFLYTVGLYKLGAFLPILIAYYDNVNGKLSESVAITSKSIEIRLLVKPDCYRWLHLANLSVEQIEFLAKKVTRTASAEENQSTVESEPIQTTSNTPTQQAPVSPSKDPIDAIFD